MGPNIFVCNENSAYIMPCVTAHAVASCVHRMVHTCRQASCPMYTLLNPGLHPWAGNPDVTGIPQVNYSTSQRQLTSTQAEVAYLTKTPITTKPVVCTNLFVHD